MGERVDGRWASKYIGISAPRQNGKSELIVARALAGVLLFGEKTIIISAHEVDTAKQVWKRLVDVVESNPTLEARVTGRMDAVNREFLAFGTGVDRQEIKLKARTKSGGRGFSADCLLLDEAQILDKRTWGAINPTVSARPNPQIWLFGTPPTPEDEPFAFTRVRESSMKHTARHTWLEWSAEPGDDFNDPMVWARANPSFGVRISLEACEDDRAAMDDDQFGMERLGIWNLDEISHDSVIPAQLWDDLTAREDREIISPVAFAVDVSPDRKHASIAAAGTNLLGNLQVEVVADGDGLSWVLGALTSLVLAHHPVTLVVDRTSAAASLLPALAAEGIEPDTTGPSEMAQACGGFYDDAIGGVLAHLGDPLLREALLGAEQRKLSDAWAWNRRGPLQITPLVSATLAHYGFNKHYKPPKAKVGRPMRSGSPGDRATHMDDLASTGF